VGWWRESGAEEGEWDGGGRVGWRRESGMEEGECGGGGRVMWMRESQVEEGEWGGGGRVGWRKESGAEEGEWGGGGRVGWWRESDCLIGQVPDAKHTAIFKVSFGRPIIAGVRESHSNVIEQVNLPHQRVAVARRYWTCTVSTLSGTH
jgi:hypothetical protein